MKTVIQHWKMQYRDYPKFACTVPCSIFSVLLENGEIQDPLFGCNEQNYIDLCSDDVYFTTELVLTEDNLKYDYVNLVFEGIDTLSEVSVNGNTVLITDNMHCSYTLNARDLLKAGRNEISVRILSAANYIREKNEAHPVWSFSIMKKGLPHLRKALYMSGWDWGPNIFDAGIWMPVYLERYNQAKLGDVFTQQIHEGEKVRLCIFAVIDGASDSCSLCAFFDGKEYAFHGGVCEIVVDRPNLWWPNGYGEPFLYKLEVQLRSGNILLDSVQKKIGFRKIAISRELDEYGREFCFKVNGEKIFAMGANIIPEENLLNRLTTEKTENMLMQCIKANFNCVRVWGGGYYPSDSFLEFCDTHGLILWQDFMFACMDVSLTPEFERSVRQEAEQIVKRLRDHACLGILCGNNEMEESFTFWGRPFPEAGVIESYRKLFHNILPEICKELVPSVFYWSSSPSSDGAFEKSRNTDDGDTHPWWPWQYGSPLDALKGDFSRFCSEFGVQSLASMHAWNMSISADQKTMFSDEMNNHQKAKIMSTAKILSYACERYGFLKDLEDYVYATQICQAISMRYTIEHYRRNRGRCMGVLYWQLNDCWSATSWSTIDYAGVWKAAHYDTMKSFAPITVTLEGNEQELILNVLNETLTPFKGAISLEVKDMRFKVYFREIFDIAVDRLSVSEDVIRKIGSIPQSEKESLFAEAVLFDQHGVEVARRTLNFVYPNKMKLEEPKIQIQARRSGENVEIVLQSNVYVHRLMLDVAHDIVHFSDNFFDITSGDEMIVTVKTELTPQYFLENLTMKSGYDVCKCKESLS